MPNLELLKEQKQLTVELARAAKAYYQTGAEIMSNYEYDKKYDRLEELEKLTNTVFAGSVVHKVGYAVAANLTKKKHASEMLSLGKTKEVDMLKGLLGSTYRGVLSWKCDGMTVVLTYENGTLVSAITRGDGVTGIDITDKAPYFTNIPLHVNYKSTLVVRGEAIITNSEFKRLNVNKEFENARNLVAGTLNSKNMTYIRQRNVGFVLFNVVAEVGTNSFAEQFAFAGNLGFTVVPHVVVDHTNVEKAVERFTQIVENKNSGFDIPVDGLVLVLDDIKYGKLLGSTEKHPRNALAFKWEDETQETVLRDIVYEPSRTGILSPVAIFDSVELEGSTVSRASLCNLNMIQNLQLGIGDKITVYKANMIIPKVAENLTKSATWRPTSICPVCGSKTIIAVSDEGTQILKCPNEHCPSRRIDIFDHFASKEGMDILGLGPAQIADLLSWGMLHEFADIYKLAQYEKTIIVKNGWGKRSFEKMQAAINTSRKCNLANFITAWGAPLVGKKVGKLIAALVDDNPTALVGLTYEKLKTVDGIGEKIARSFVDYFAANYGELNRLAMELHFIIPEKKAIVANDAVAGKVFVVTGDVTHFKNRNELSALIETMGGKTASSVTAKTAYLINNDINSASSKNQKAKELGTPIITEEEFLRMIGKM